MIANTIFTPVSCRCRIHILKTTLHHLKTGDRPYYPALDGLRGIAILLVLLYHNFGFIKLFEIGWLGVDLFFVLSGFLITDILLQTKGTKHFLRNFYFRRFLRILPLYYLCLLLFIFFLPRITGHFYNAAYYQTNQVWFWAYLQNWLYIFKSPEQSSFLNHFWSLAVEEQFYLIWPLIILCTASSKVQLKIILALLLLVICLRVGLWIGQPYHISYINLYTFSRIDGLCIGCALSLVRKLDVNLVPLYVNKILLFIAGINAVAVLLKYGAALDFPYDAFVGYPSIAILFGLVVTRAIDTKPNLIKRYINQSPFRYLGKISYSLYVFHWPVYLMLFPMIKSLLERMSTSSASSQWVSAGIATLCAFGISVLSYRVIEKYFLSLRPVVVA